MMKRKKKIDSTAKPFAARVWWNTCQPRRSSHGEAGEYGKSVPPRRDSKQSQPTRKDVLQDPTLR
jgi:hypothetical protein